MSRDASGSVAPADARVLRQKAVEDQSARSILPALGARQVLLMLAVNDLGDESYGARIATWLEEATGVAVNMGQIYSVAGGLSEDGILAEEEPQSRGKGRPVIVYRLTALGEIMMRAAAMKVRTKR